MNRHSEVSSARPFAGWLLGHLETERPPVLPRVRFRSRFYAGETINLLGQIDPHDAVDRRGFGMAMRLVSPFLFSLLIADLLYAARCVSLDRGRRVECR